MPWPTTGRGIAVSAAGCDDGPVEDEHQLTEGLTMVLTDARSIGYAMRLGRGWQEAAERAAEREREQRQAARGLPDVE